MPDYTPHVIFSSDGFNVRLDANELYQYQKEVRELEDRWMIIEQQRRGIWASNQGKYVKSVYELNEYDTPPRVLATEIMRGY